MFHEQSSCQNTSRQKKILASKVHSWIKNTCHENTLSNSKRENTTKSSIYLLYSFKFNYVKRNMHVVLWRTFPIYWCLQWEWTTNLCNYWFIGLMNPMGVNLVIMDSLGLGLLMEFAEPDNISIIGHVFLKLCIMYFYRKGQYWQIVWLEHVIHPMFLLWCLF